MQTHLWVVKPDQSLPPFIFLFCALPKPYLSPLDWVQLHSFGISDRSGNMGVTHKLVGICGDVVVPCWYRVQSIIWLQWRYPCTLVSKGRAHHYSLQNLQSQAETQAFVLCAVQARSMMNYMAWSACNPNKQHRVGGNTVLPLLQRGQKTQGNNKLDSLRWVEEVASFPHLIITPLLLYEKYLTEY